MDSNRFFQSAAIRHCPAEPGFTKSAHIIDCGFENFVKHFVEDVSTRIGILIGLQISSFACCFN